MIVFDAAIAIIILIVAIETIDLIEFGWKDYQDNLKNISFSNQKIIDKLHHQFMKTIAKIAISAFIIEFILAILIIL